MISNSPTCFIVTGHVDHGKSTFIGRLLLEMGAIPQDRFENLKKEGRFEYAHLTDALADERQKGITIGVSQTPFSYQGRDFVLLDAPGHVEFLQNMVTGASRAEIAFFVVDVAEGLQASSLRHLHMLSFLGVSQIVVLINKMDLVHYSEKAFRDLNSELGPVFTRLGLTLNLVIPVAAYEGENLSSRSEKMPWYQGPTALQALGDPALQPQKKHDNFLSFSVQDIYGNSVVGETLNGQLKSGSYLCFQSGEKISLQLNTEHYQGSTHQSFELSSDSKLKRGDLLTENPEAFTLGSSFEVNMIWFSNMTLVPGEWIELRLAKQQVRARIQSIQFLFDSSRLEALPKNSSIEKGSVVKCLMEIETPIAFTAFKKNSQLGRFILLKNALISGAGKII